MTNPSTARRSQPVRGCNVNLSTPDKAPAQTIETTKDTTTTDKDLPPPPPVKDTTTSTPAIDNAAALPFTATPSPSTSLRPGGNAGQTKSYKSSLMSTPVVRNAFPNSFNVLQEYATDPANFDLGYDSDDDTVNNSNISTYSARFKLMVAIPKDDVDDDEAKHVAISIVNEMLKSLRNKFPQDWKIAPWNIEKVTKNTKLYALLPKDIDQCETLIHNYNRHNVAPGRFCYYRLHLLFPNDVPLQLIHNEVKSYTKSRVQFFHPAPSNALNPVSIGTFTGAVQEMAESVDFKQVLCKMFGFKHLGLTWMFGKSYVKGYNQDKFKLHGEIDMMDLKKADKLKAYLNGPSKTVVTNPFGTPLLLIEEHDNSLSQTDKDRVYNQVVAQESISKSLDKVVVTGIKVTNWITNTDTKQETLLQRLMETQSITAKRTIRNEKTFYGRLFYAIVPNTAARSATFYFTRANMKEGRSVARALPLFIQEEFKKSAKFFCDDELLASANEGFWNKDTRRFETIAEREENDRLQTLKDHAHADVIEFISADHQRAMRSDMDEVDDASRLTKGTKEAPDYNGVSPLASMGTTESKAARAADARELIVTKQLTETYHAKLEDRDNQISDLTAKMDSFATFARMMENFSPEQLQKLTGASNDQIQNMQEEVDQMSDDSDDEMSNDGSNDSDVEIITDLEDTKKLDAASDNSVQDEIMKVTRKTNSADVFGHMQDDDGSELSEPIAIENSDTVVDEDMSETHTGIEYSLSRVAASPRRKKTALSDTVKLLGTKTASRDIIATNKKAKEHDTRQSSPHTDIEGLDVGKSD